MVWFISGGVAGFVVGVIVTLVFVAIMMIADQLKSG